MEKDKISNTMKTLANEQRNPAWPTPSKKSTVARQRPEKSPQTSQYSLPISIPKTSGKTERCLLFSKLLRNFSRKQKPLFI